MKINLIPSYFLAVLATLAFTTFTSSGPAVAETLDDLAAAAKSEGKVVVFGPAHQAVRRILPVAFKKRFGIEMEYIGGRGSAAAAKLRKERAAGLYTADAALAGIQTMSRRFYMGGMLDPLKPLLLPQNLDGSKWKKGEPWFIDPEKKYALRLFSYVAELFTINTDYVKPADYKTAKGLLLNPKWKGKIVAHDPRRSGTGSNKAAQLYLKYGRDFLQKFYVDQKPRISRRERQITDWLLRGTYPIIMGGDFAEMEKMRKEGLPVKSIFFLSDLPASLSGGNGNLVVFNKRPHPKATKLLVNWLASKEGLEVYARASKRATTRNDIDEAAFLPSQRIPKPGVKYFDTYDWEFSVKTKKKVRRMVKKMMGKKK
jgi:ABC-type Fe3+ transport system substrate-binding protein